MSVYIKCDMSLEEGCKASWEPGSAIKNAMRWGQQMIVLVGGTEWMNLGLLGCSFIRKTPLNLEGQDSKKNLKIDRDTYIN